MQLAVMAFSRPNLSESLTTTIRERIVNGDLPAGERVNEVHLAKSLGISRTPLREALGRLVAEGALEIVPRYGYYVCPLTYEEFKDIYRIRPILDPEALRLAGIPSATDLDELENLNAQIARESDPEEVINLDDVWHMKLLARCSNRELLNLIEQNIRKTRRYEMALMRERKNVGNAADEHAAIIKALRAGDLNAACDALRKNMQSGFEPIAAWLEERES